MAGEFKVKNIEAQNVSKNIVDDGTGVKIGDISNNVASGDYSLANGYNTTADGWASHSEGYKTTASGYGSHAEGVGAKASGNYSHSSGHYTNSIGIYSHAEGYNTTASGTSSFAFGAQTTASGNYTFAWSDGTNFEGTLPQSFNIHATNGVHISGGGLYINGQEAGGSGDIQSYVDPISANLQGQIDTNVTNIDTKLDTSVFAAISGNFLQEDDDSAYATNSNLSAISGNLQTQIDNIIVTNTSTNVTTSEVIDSVPVSGGNTVGWGIVVISESNAINRYSSNIISLSDGTTTVDYSEFGVLKTNSTPIY